MLLKQTKIVATISDQRCDVDFIKQLFDAGLNVVRMNTAHAGREGFEKLIANVRTVSNRIAILMDTKGPEVRTTVLAETCSLQGRRPCKGSRQSRPADHPRMYLRFLP